MHVRRALVSLASAGALSTLCMIGAGGAANVAGCSSTVGNPIPNGALSSSGASGGSYGNGGGSGGASSSGSGSGSSGGNLGSSSGSFSSSGSSGDDSGDDSGGDATTGDDGAGQASGDDASGDSAATSDDAGQDVATQEMDASSPPPVDASPPPVDAPGSDGLVCANLGCFDVFDCAIYHAAQFGPCGFTQCVNLICQ